MTTAPNVARAGGGDDARPPWAPVLLAATALVLLLDLLRVLMPSISFVYGRLGSTPAGEMAIVAVLVFGAGGLVARATSLDAGIAVPVTAVLAAGARLGLAATDGGNPQMLAASLGVVASIALLGALATSDLPPRALSRGLALGFLAHATLNAILWGQDAHWYGGAVSWLVAVATAAALVVAWSQARPTRERPDVRTTLPWLVLGPLVAVHSIFALSPGALRSGFVEEVPFTGAGLAAAVGAGYVLGRVVVGSFLREATGVVALTLSALAGIVTLGTTTGTVAIATLVVAAFVPLVLVLAGEARDDVLASRGRRAGAVGLGMAIYLVIAMGYYVAYQVDLGMPRTLFPAAAVVLAGVVLQRAEARSDADAPFRPEDAGTVALAPFLALFVLIASTSSVPAPRATASYEDVRVMTYNVRMGFDLDGRFNAEELAAVIRREQPDVVVLNEVDRGWALTGGHDVLAIIARELRMDAAFGPAADAVWGNAILSRFPMSDVEVRELPAEGSVMGRSAISARLDLGAGEVLGVIGTHFSHEDDEDVIRADQAAVIAEMATEMQLQGVPVAVLGDLNAEPGDGELAPLSNLVDAVAVAAQGVDTATFPSDAPTGQIDHVLVSPGFGASDLSIPRTTASDHLAVAVTLRGRSRTTVPSPGDGTGPSTPASETDAAG